MSKITPVVVAFISGAVVSHVLRRKRASVIRRAVEDIKNETPLRHVTPENIETVKTTITDIKDALIERVTDTIEGVRQGIAEKIHEVEQTQKNKSDDLWAEKETDVNSILNHINAQTTEAGKVFRDRSEKLETDLKNLRKKKGTPSVLQDRIDAGLADPISDEEREIVAGMVKHFEEKYGHKPNAITNSERSAAARIVMKMDKKLGLKTDPEVRKLAEQKSALDDAGDPIDDEERAEAARIVMSMDKKFGWKTDSKTRKLAEGTAVQPDAEKKTDKGVSEQVADGQKPNTDDEPNPAPKNSMKPDEWAKNLVTKSAPIRSALQDRINKGLAEPISEREKQQLKELKDAYTKRFGKKP